ncbi:MAG: flavin reductase family protein [Candidatus Sericytochromatia bacterium]|nr:flavin reductase family protein [Candidatus Sericytochromatia bacterium]
MILDPAAGSWNDAYRLVTSVVVPRPIAFVSTLGPDGVPNLAPFSFFTVVCANPLTICFAPMRRGPAAEKKDTLKNLEASGEFVVNVVDERWADAMNLTSADFAPEVSEFEAAGFTPAACEVVKAPRVLESPVSLECQTYQVVEVGQGPGSGSLVIGTVVRAHVRDDVFLDGAVRPSAGWQPIARCGGATYIRLTDTFELARPAAPPPAPAGR